MQPSRVWLPYTQHKTAPEPLVASRTQGSRIYLEDGRCLIDGVASWWTACHGYNHPHIRAAVEEQLATMPHVMLGGLVHGPVLELSRRLAEVLPGDIEHMFFSESGSVAVEVAMKMVLQYWINRGDRARRRFLSFRHGYHGDTFAAMSVCDPVEGMHSLFAGTLAEQAVVALPRSDADFARFEGLLDREGQGLAGLIIEPLVQAAGGMKFHDPGTLERIVGLARERGLLILFDEIATGFGRTGSMFACDQIPSVPDIVTLSKALTGGTMPLAVTCARRHVYEAFESDDPDRALMHGPTFTGNPLACAAALASLDLFETEPRLDQAAAVGERLAAGLGACSGLDGVVDVRTRGAIGVVQLEPPVDCTALRQRFLREAVWVRPFGDVVYLMPALTIDQDELDQLINAVVEVVREWSRAR